MDVTPLAYPLGFFYEACGVIERCYDGEIPLPFRLKDLGEVLARAAELVTVDKELFLWAAASRWLARIKSFALGKTTLNQYEGLSLRLSDGRDHDVLRCMRDMLERGWYLDPGSAEDESETLTEDLKRVG